MDNNSITTITNLLGGFSPLELVVVLLLVMWAGFAYKGKSLFVSNARLDKLSDQIEKLRTELTDKIDANQKANHEDHENIIAGLIDNKIRVAKLEAKAEVKAESKK